MSESSPTAQTDESQEPKERRSLNHPLAAVCAVLAVLLILAVLSNLTGWTLASLTHADPAASSSTAPPAQPELAAEPQNATLPAPNAPTASAPVAIVSPAPAQPVASAPEAADPADLAAAPASLNTTPSQSPANQGDASQAAVIANFEDQLVTTAWNWAASDAHGTDSVLHFRQDGYVWVDGGWSGCWVTIAPNSVRVTIRLVDHNTQVARLVETALNFNESMSAYRSPNFCGKAVYGASRSPSSLASSGTLATPAAGASARTPALEATPVNATMASSATLTSATSADSSIPALETIPFEGRIDALETNLASMVGWTTLPLSEPIPQNIQTIVSSIESGILQEQSDSPVFDPDVYFVALRICNAVNDALRERNEALARIALLVAGERPNALLLAWGARALALRNSILGLHQQLAVVAHRSPKWVAFSTSSRAGSRLTPILGSVQSGHAAPPRPQRLVLNSPPTARPQPAAVRIPPPAKPQPAIKMQRPAIAAPPAGRPRMAPIQGPGITRRDPRFPLMP